MARTATATPRVARGDRARGWGCATRFRCAPASIGPNLAFDVVGVEGKGAMARKRAALMHVLRDRGGAGPAIVYCGTRKDTDAVAELIRAGGDHRRSPTTPA